MNKESDIYYPEYHKGFTDGYKEGYTKALENYMDQIHILKSAPQIIVECRLNKCDFYKNR